LRAAILPLGSYEEHEWLPMDTDTRIAVCVAARLSSQTGWPVLPALPYGFSPEHEEKAVSLGASTLSALLRDVAESSGAELLLVVNGHGGNKPVVEAVMFEYAGRTRILLLDVWSAASRVLGLCGSPVIHGGLVEASLASACGVNPAGGRELGEAEALEKIRAAGCGPEALEKPWRNRELPRAEHVYSKALGEKILEELVSRALSEIDRAPGPRL
jgi:creatinine amidohydrolase/Fe(II)-dependent formamide hydrolase-like protein